MNYLQECLTLGQWLGELNQRALYKYFLISKSDEYISDAKKLLSNKMLKKTIANGEIYYFVEQNIVKYKVSKIGTNDLTGEIRKLKLQGTKKNKINKLKKFFAQSEVDVLQNYPLLGLNPQEESGFGWNTYPFYDLNYYSNGKGRIKGFIRKMKIDDSEILNKLLAS